MSADDEVGEAGDRTVTATGVVRVTIERRQAGRCHTCAWTFDNMGAAVSHARASGYLVEATYSATYLYLPPQEPRVGGQ